MDFKIRKRQKTEGRCLFCKDDALKAVLDDIAKRNYNGMDKSWVNKLMLARITHYRRARKAA